MGQRQTEMNNMHQAKISVIIPVYNVETYLERCVESVLNQSFADFEVILVDDGSTDSSGKICDTFSEKFQNVKTFHIDNAGVSSARNCGIEYSNSEYIVFVDSDDYIDKFMLDKLYCEVHEHDVDLCLCGYTQIFADKNVDVLPEDGTYDFQEFLDVMKYWKLNCVIGSPCNKIYNRSVIEKHQIRFRIDMNYAEDYLFNINYFMHIHKIRVLGKSYYNYYKETPNSLSKKNYLNPDIVWENQVYVFNELKNLLLAHQVEIDYHNVLGDMVCDIVCINFLQRVNKYGFRKSTLWINSLHGNKLIELSFRSTKKISQVRFLNIIYKYVRFVYHYTSCRLA
ncbi:MAG: glycosyltransferase family 2 protein [Lachnospiraceae bacterium]|nr:glycosyltransferase family 2 protein [Lachnospiraceae bacterium]